MGYDLDENGRAGAGRSRRRKSTVLREKPTGGQDQRTANGAGQYQAGGSDQRQAAAGTLPAPRKKKTSKTRRRIITMIIAECFALLFIFGYGFVARRWNMIQRMEDWVPEEVENPNFSVDLPQYAKQKGHWGIYIFGVDSRGSNVGKGTNADVNMICDINHDTGEIRLVSVFRDSYLNVNDNGSYNKINQAYFTGGPSNAAKMLNKNLDLNIGDFVTFNWKAVADGINILGGVDMEISNAEFYYINSFITETVEATGVYSTHLKKAGMNHLDGVQAVAYGRLRLMDTDFARTERQRKVIQAAFEKAKKADFATLNQLTLTLFPQVATSVDMQDIISLLGDVGKYYIGETGGFPFARGDANMGKKGACVIPQTLESNVKELHQFLYGEENYVPSNTVKQISAKISSDTGMYTQGVSVGHVSTSGGAIPSSTKAAKVTEAAEKETGKSNEADSSEASSRESKDSDEEKDSEKEKESEKESTKAGGSETKSTEDSSSPSRVETRPTTTLPAAERPGGGSHSVSPADRTDNHPVEEPTASSPGQSSEGSSDSGVHPGGSSENPTAAEKPDMSSTLSPADGNGPGTGGSGGPTSGSGPGNSSQGTISPGNTGGPGTGNSSGPGNSGSQGSITVPSPDTPGASGADPVQPGSGVTTIPAGPNIS
ncbi:MAG: LCP family protein [Lachnospiraceae bacterium]|nr:LCP family protein [Lachnospiraceae bacterium]MDO5551138.1 LCP family protein [Lachnospiraceae bacterium]